MKKQYKGHPDAMSAEDFDMLVAIAEHLVQELGLFKINLPNGVSIGNGPDTVSDKFTFAGIDAIQETFDKLKNSGAPTPYEIIMPTENFKIRTLIGEMFEMKLYVDPNCPPDRFIIRAEEKQLTN
jgi:hypothetical protein